jgi:hypothetical protein
MKLEIYVSQTCFSKGAGKFYIIPRLYITWHVGLFAVGVGWGMWFAEIGINYKTQTPNKI